MNRVYILFDERAAHGVGTEDAMILVVCEDDKEAQSYKGEFGPMACYSYEPESDKPNCALINERFEWNWFPDKKKRK